MRDLDRWSGHSYVPTFQRRNEPNPEARSEPESISAADSLPNPHEFPRPHESMSRRQGLLTLIRAQAIARLSCAEQAWRGRTVGVGWAVPTTGSRSIGRHSPPCESYSPNRNLKSRGPGPQSDLSTWAEDGGSHPYHGRAFGDRRLQIGGHAH